MTLKEYYNKSFSDSSSLLDLVKAEALNNCSIGNWASFLCILALSSVIGQDIRTLYPGCDKSTKIYSLLCNQTIKPVC